MKNKKRIAMVLTISQIRDLKQMANNAGLSFSEFVRRILDEYLKSRPAS